MILHFAEMLALRFDAQTDFFAAKSAQASSVTRHRTTHAASYYGLLDEKTFTPVPNYLATPPWQRLMGTTVLKSDSAQNDNLHLYAHCMRDVSDLV